MRDSSCGQFRPTGEANVGPMETEMTRLEAMAEALKLSKEFKCVQHVESEDGIHWQVSDWYGDTTVYSYENGRLKD